MKVLKDINIYYYDNGVQKVRYKAPVTEGAVVHYELMNSHYVKLSFDTVKPIDLQIGDFVNTQWGRFEITEKYNPTFDGRTYTYEPQFEAYYRKWKNKTCLYIPTTGGNETSFNLTASIGVHARVILKNLAYLGKKDKSYFFNPDYTASKTLSDDYNSDSVVYSDTDFTVEFDTSVDTKKARLVTYQNSNILDAISSIAQTFECEWWVTENVIHLGTCKLEQDSNIELKIGTNVDTISASQSQANYATRLYSFGAEKNLPDSYKDNISEDVTKDGVVQKRLMLPTTSELEAYSKTSATAKAAVDNINKLLKDNGFELSGNALQISGISEQQAIESVLINEDDYPKNIIKVGKISSYQRTVDNQETATEGDKITRTYYRVSGLKLVDEDGNETGDTNYLDEYRFQEKELHLIFQSGALNGLDFVCVFNPDSLPVYKVDSDGHFLDKDGNVTTDKTKYVINPDAQVFEITANEDYGRFLPDENLHPNVGDTFVLYNWDATKMSGNLVINASIDLLLDTIEYLKKSMIDPSTYTITMLAESVFDGTFYTLGTAVRLYHNAYFKGGYRDSRIIGYEFKLDIPYDGAQYIIGEKPSYSKIGELSKQISEVTLNGQSYSGSVGGGSSVYLVKQNDLTPFSDTNALSSLRAKDEFLSKKEPDTAQKLIKFLEGTQVGQSFISGLLGTGGIFRMDADGKTYIEADRLYIRMKAYFDTVEYRKTQNSGGNRIASPAGGKIIRVENVGEGDDKDINPNLAYNTSGDWSKWIELGDVNRVNICWRNDITLINNIKTTQNVCFSIEIEVDILDSNPNKALIVAQGNDGFKSVNDWNIGTVLSGNSFSFSGNDTAIKLSNGINRIEAYRQPVRESNVYGWQLRCDYTRIRFRYRKAKVEYGTKATSYDMGTMRIRCYFRAKDSDDNEVKNEFAVGDQAFCQITNVRNGSLVQHRFWRLVTGRNEEGSLTDNDEYWIDLSVTDCEEGSDIPQVQDSVSTLGNRNDSTRQGAIIEYSTGENAPSYQIYQGINSYSLSGKNYVDLGYNSGTGKAYLNVYGDAYIGDKDGKSYFKYNSTDKQITIKAAIEATSTIDGKTVQEYVKGNSLSKDDVNKLITDGTKQKFDDLQKQADGAIETWYYEGVPTLTNSPAKDWATDAIKDTHIGDLYYDKNTKFAYRFLKDGDVYTWEQIQDTDITKALGEAQQKRRIFVTTPKPPYDEGDLWVNATYPNGTTETDEANHKYFNEILRCSTSKKDGNFDITNWELASKYTDDTALKNFTKQMEQVLGKDYLKKDYSYLLNELAHGSTEVNGGLVLSNMLGLKDSDGTVTAGMNGLVDKNLGNQLSTIAAWYGGQPKDRQNYVADNNGLHYVDKDADSMPTDAAKTLFRMDGSGYIASGNIAWDETGHINVKDLYLGNTKIDDTVETILNAFHFTTSTDGKNTVLSILPNAAFSELYIGTKGDANCRVVTAKEISNLTWWGQKADANGKVDGNLLITTNAHGTWEHFLDAHSPNMTQGDELEIRFGKKGTPHNEAYIGYHHNGDDSNSNLMTFGFWGMDRCMNLMANGNLGIGTTSPAYKLDVQGSIRTTQTLTIGGVILSYDATNKALKVDGNMYATGGVSALGMSTTSSSGGSGATALSDLVDTVINSPTANQVLSYDSTQNKWVNKTIVTDGISSVTTTGSGNAVTAVEKNGTGLTVTKGATFLTQHQSLANYLPLTGGTMRGTLNLANNIGIVGLMAGGSDNWSIFGSGEKDNGILRISVADNALSDWLYFDFNDYTGAKYTPLKMTGNQVLFSVTPMVNGTALALTSDIPTKVSQLSNDANYLATANLGTLTIQGNGTTIGAFKANGNSTVNITPSGIGAIPFVDKIGWSYAAYKGTGTQYVHVANLLKKNQDDHPIIIEGSFRHKGLFFIEISVAEKTIKCTRGDISVGLCDVDDNYLGLYAAVSIWQVFYIYSVKVGANTDFIWINKDVDKLPDGIVMADASTPPVWNATMLNGVYPSQLSVLSATRLQTPRTISLSGDASGSVSFDGSSNVTLNAAVTSVKDSGNNVNVTFAFSKAGLSSTPWLAGWNGYELRAISPSVITVGAANKLSTARTLWGQSFDGTGNVDGDLRNAYAIINGTGWNHAIILGKDGRDRVDFHEYGGLWNFYQNTGGKTDGSDNVLIGRISSNAYLSGNLGIGTTSPSCKFEVCGNSHNTGWLQCDGLLRSLYGVQTENYVQIGDVRLVYDSANTAIKVVKSNGDVANLYATGGISALGAASLSSDVSNDVLFSNISTGVRQIRFQVGNNDYFRVAGGATGTNAGYGEIATADDGNEPVYVRQYTGVFSNVTRTLTLLDGSGNSDFPGNVHIHNQMQVDGDVTLASQLKSIATITTTSTITCQSLTQTSDARLKDIISDATLKVSDIANAPSLKFTWKNDKNGMGVMVGSIAQYWQRVLPETVRQNNDGYLTLQYGVTALLASISIAKKVEEHERAISELKQEIDNLKKGK